jgi:hypothetical protein
VSTEIREISIILEAVNIFEQQIYILFDREFGAEQNGIHDLRGGKAV